MREQSQSLALPKRVGTGLATRGYTAPDSQQEGKVGLQSNAALTLYPLATIMAIWPNLHFLQN